MTEVREAVDCMLCHSPDYEPILPAIPDTDSDISKLEEPFKSMTFTLVRCTKCGTVYLRDRVVQAEIGRFYSSEYHCYKPFEERGTIMKFLALALIRLKIQAMAKLMPKDADAILDYGCGSGGYLELMKMAQVPWRLIGCDIIQSQVDAVRNMGIEAFVLNDETLKDSVPRDAKIGVAHLNHVIEHLPDPVRTLRKIAEVLVPGGVIYGQTPNVDSWDCRLFGKYWAQWHVPRHLVLYTPDTLRKHAQAAGLEVCMIKNSLSAATNWANSLLKKQALEAGDSSELASHPLYPALILSFIPVAAAQSVLSSTSNLDFAFRKVG